MAAKRRSRRGKFPSMDAPDPTFQINMGIRKVSEKQKDRETLRNGYAVKKQELDRELEEKCEPYDRAIDELVCGIFTRVEDNRGALTQGKMKKVIQFTAGAIRQRFTSSTSVFDEKKAVRWMKRHGLKKYIRRKVIEEVNKQSTNSNRKKIAGRKIPGLSIDYTEFFTVTPKATEIPITLPVPYLKRLAKKAAKKKG